MSTNHVLQFMEDIIYFRTNQDEEGMRALMKEGEAESVTLKDVGSAFIQVVDDLTEYVDAAQGLSELRLIAIIKALPREIQETVMKDFNDVGDDLLHLDLEGEKL